MYRPAGLKLKSLLLTFHISLNEINVSSNDLSVQHRSQKFSANVRGFAMLRTAEM
jgi:hypothetical protein